MEGVNLLTSPVKSEGLGLFAWGLIGGWVGTVSWREMAISRLTAPETRSSVFKYESESNDLTSVPEETRQSMPPVSGEVLEMSDET